VIKLNSYFLVVAVLAGGIGLNGCSRRAKHPAEQIATASAAAPASGAPIAPSLSSDVELVKRGSLPEYKDTTIDQAFEKTFQKTEWKPGVNIQGQNVVRLSGTLKYSILKGAGFYLGTWNGVTQGIEAEKQIAARRRECPVKADETSDAELEACMAKVYESMVIPVSFDFTLSPDKKVVNLTLVDPVFQKFDPDHRLRVQRAATLALIYQ
jgi:hypothetical protein